MRGKKAKALRRKAKELTYQYVCERVLPPDLTKEEEYDTIVGVIPYRTYFMRRGVIKLGLTSRRWIEKQLKRNPSMTYEELLEKANLA